MMSDPCFTDNIFVHSRTDTWGAPYYWFIGAIVAFLIWAAVILKKFNKTNVLLTTVLTLALFCLFFYVLGMNEGTRMICSAHDTPTGTPTHTVTHTDTPAGPDTQTDTESQPTIRQIIHQLRKKHA